MNLNKTLLAALFICCSTLSYGQYTDVINSNRPGVSRSAFSVGTNVAQFEVGPYMVKEEREPSPSYSVSGWGVDFAARYGLLWEPLEINIEGTFQRDTKTFDSEFAVDDKRGNFKFLALGAKYLVYDPYKHAGEEKPNLYSWKANNRFKWKSLIPAVAVYLGANYDLEDNPYVTAGVEGVSPKIMIATQHNFSGGWVFVMNFIKDRIGTDQSDFQYILTLTHSFNPKWVIFAETQGIKSDFYADNLLRGGAAYLLGKDFQIDAAVTTNFKDTPSVFNATIGASYRLDFHKDKEIDNGNSKKDVAKRGKKVKNKKNKDNNNQENVIKRNQKKEIDF
ncbi:transporter [Neotamlana laminarinivorans]|uniref:Transporter n=1 Tax=Neotamlana laminarinivorans TaxID=2883124 RepID=A0A9X1L2W1_9FLAO|nr:transporter [Tamlana laminarinivorans]MCB4797622.1 transporter [Tamlana laminarinivorans]